MKHILSVWNIKGRKDREESGDHFAPLSGSIKLFSITLLVILLFISCSTLPEPVSEQMIRAVSDPELTETQEKLIEGSFWALGRKKLKVNGKVFNLDCSGTVMAVYYYAGIDLSREFNKYSGGGTSRIHQYLEDKDLLYTTELPSPGDIIFWDNTYDSNGDKIRNDDLTHMGIVVEVSEKGTVTYLHEHYKKGIILESMNLIHPDDPGVNSAMRMKGTGMNGGWLASHLYRELAMGYILEE